MRNKDAALPSATLPPLPGLLPPSSCNQSWADSHRAEYEKKLRCQRQEPVDPNCAGFQRASDRQNRPSAFFRACNYPEDALDQLRYADCNLPIGGHRSIRPLPLLGDTGNRPREANANRNQKLRRSRKLPQVLVHRVLSFEVPAHSAQLAPFPTRRHFFQTIPGKIQPRATNRHRASAQIIVTRRAMNSRLARSLGGAACNRPERRRHAHYSRATSGSRSMNSERSTQAFQTTASCVGPAQLLFVLQFYIRRPDTRRYLYRSAADDLSAQRFGLFSYENITLIRTSVCHPGCGRHSRVRPNPDYNQHRRRRLCSNQQADRHKGQGIARRRHRRN